MSATFPRRCRLALIAAACVALAGCSSFNNVTRNFASSLAPYQIEVVQGNFVSKEQVEALRPGMTRLQVREVLGTPLLASVFHANRWEYVFTFKRQGVAPQSRKLAVFFNGDLLERFEGDDMPTEADFVALLDPGRRTGKVPVLQASEERLKAFAPASAASAAAAPAAAAPLPTSYPPLEAPAR